ncbi:MAG: DNA polymerase/3'-5' exonuclease PolX [Gammaproteobacteria bacterium]
MTVHNEDIAVIFDRIADFLEIQGANPFRIRAYRNASRELRNFGEPMTELVLAGKDLSLLPTIGKDLAGKITEIVETGECRALDELLHEFPSTLPELLAIPGLGPKRVGVLYRDLGIENLELLEAAAKAGRIRELPGFGLKTEAGIVKALRSHRKKNTRFQLSVAEQYAEPLVDYLSKAGGVSRVVVAGSYRRRRDTVGDIDILVTTKGQSDVIRYFAEYGEIKRMLSRGTTRATGVLASGLQVDLRVVQDVSFGAALVYFTGSKAHNIVLRRLGQMSKLKINEYGVFKGQKRIAGKTEKSVFNAVALPYIEPELRENQGEIEAAQQGHLPQLVQLSELRGDLHTHTSASDGRDPIEDMVRVAREHGFRYIAITDHSPSLRVAGGIGETQLRRQFKTIDRLNERFDDCTVLKGIEVEILKDGRLGLSDDVLADLDIVIGAVHSHFGLSRTQQTDRIIRALDNPKINVLAHPSGRLLFKRDAYDVDLPRVIKHAAACGCALELNSQPDRLDLTDQFCRLAKSEGALVAVNSDAHSVKGFENLKYGIGQARRGWLEASEVLNTRSLAAVRKFLRRTG